MGDNASEIAADLRQPGELQIIDYHRFSGVIGRRIDTPVPGDGAIAGIIIDTVVCV